MGSICVDSASLASEFDSFNSEGYRVIIELDGKVIGKTGKAATKNLEPRWNQEIELTQKHLLKGVNLTLTVYISRKNWFNTVCGIVDVDLRHALNAGSIQTRIAKRRDSVNEVTGTLNIKCSRQQSLNKA
eukprot:gnl/MRDRNA2_/MRDRNA2_29127_c0_seq1.p1 gnl/MRDRNA2_/MRDRNA2_29127_c0~~gnl/MRDRNA2_/MRDRNA2_29127_c0_seq1.p1  ORF type:complete len:130 (+),score=18.15 gnl/MRDRNA2_/MRDRNA2_29127_c0_seq1:76-465(+)